MPRLRAQDVREGAFSSIQGCAIIQRSWVLDIYCTSDTSRMTRIRPEAMQRLWRLASERGEPALKVISRVVNVAGRCTNPVYREFSALAEDPALWHLRRGERGRSRIAAGIKGLGTPLKATVEVPERVLPIRVKAPPPIYADVWLPCRKCPNCLRARAALWRQRANNEIVLSTRTWFGTFTINPYNRFLIDTRGRRSDAASDDNYLDRHRQVCRYLTLYFKRLRKSSRSKIRYMLVAEHHADGWPHYHVLIHERGVAVTKRELQGQWPYGFTHFKLIDRADKRVSGYICKYISKQALARIRASLKYGTI